MITKIPTKRLKELNVILSNIETEKEKYIRDYKLSEDDLWILIDRDIHAELLSHPDRVNEGSDRITRSQILGMHAIHDKVKRAYVVPKKKIPEMYPSHDYQRRWNNG